MRPVIGVILFLFFSFPALSRHIIGGEMYYNFKRKDGNNYQYEIILKLYRGCEAQDENHANLDPVVQFSIFNNDDNELQGITDEIYMEDPNNTGLYTEKIEDRFHDPCIHNAPTTCYQVGYYRTIINVPINDHGYTVAFQRCCRNNKLKNANSSFNVGATYFTDIPGLQTGIPGDNSPRFEKEEAILLCSKGNIKYTFHAKDPDGDELKYDFAPGYIGGSQKNLAPVPTSKPPFDQFTYQSGFSGEKPLGEGVTIDQSTGELKGRTDLNPGTYDITVRVRSYRNGNLIATHYRDFQFEINNCKREVLADIPPLYNECNSFTIPFDNNSTTGKDYHWDFGDGQTSTEYTPTHTFQDSGTYHVQIKVDPQSNCGDSMESIVKVYPKLIPDFSVDGVCIQAPIHFTDNSQTADKDHITAYQWEIGDPTHKSTESNPQRQFTKAGDYPINLTVSTALGCEQTVTKNFHFYDPPELEVTSDTIFCYKDPVSLEASSNRTGQYLWTTNYNINNTHVPNPTTTPQKDTTYRVMFTDNHGCFSEDSVRLRIKHDLLVEAGQDTTICAGDEIFLQAKSDEDYAFTWFDNNNNTIGQSRDIHPVTPSDEVYRVEATLGSCSATDQRVVDAVPYPDPVVVPSDTTICYGDTISLVASGGAYYQWEPAEGLSQTDKNAIFAFPETDITYTVAVTDTLGCPKPVEAAIPIRVIPPIQAFAGKDTIITTGQTFQLHATGGDSYNWSPAIGLSDPNISNPLVQRTEDITYHLTAISLPAGCEGYDSIHVRYIEGPEVYVPSAFTPNGDGQNDIFRPIPVGMTDILYFSVYDRWGKLVYTTKDYMKGWDGKYKGKPAEPGAYVWMVKATDFNGNTVERKGSVLLIR